MKRLLVAAGALFFVIFAAYGFLLSRFPRRYRETVENGGIAPSLVYAVMKAESNFREDAVSRAGALGLMQLMPSTAEFICAREGIGYERERLLEGEYNVRLGCLYLKYLLERFPDRRAALAAYNAGEGTVRDWLRDPSCSEDGLTLRRIPYPETASYVKKVEKFRKIYEIFY